MPTDTNRTRNSRKRFYNNNFVDKKIISTFATINSKYTLFMNGTMTLEQSAIRTNPSLSGNERALRPSRPLSRKLKREAKQDDSNVMTAADKKRILADIKEALIELKMANEGKIQLQTWEEVKHELHI